MTLMFHAACRRGLAAIAVGTAVALAVACAITSAHASLTPGTGWTAVTLPANYAIANGSNGPVPSPVSCAPGKHFCVVVAANSAVKGPGGSIGQGALVSYDERTWHHYERLPSSSMHVTAISCPATKVCYISGRGPRDQPRVARSISGGTNWTRLNPPGWGTAFSWWPNSIDCVSTTTCWLAGMTAGSTPSPVVVETTDNGSTWTTFSNLPSGPNGSYQLNGISCTSAVACVAVGGVARANGTATVISTTDGGVTWSRSIDATLEGIQQLFSVSCRPGTLATCHAAGQALQGSGPTELASPDGGATWKGVESRDSAGRLNSISCPDTRHCWAAGAQTQLALLGTSNGGRSWSAQTAETPTEVGSVSCATVDLCIATTDNALWVTRNGGGLAVTAASGVLGSPGWPGASPQVASPVRALPRFSPRTLWARSGRSVRVTGQYKGATAPASASVTIKLPSGTSMTTTAPIGLNHYYSVAIAAVARGTTTVKFTAGSTGRSVKVIGHTAAAPTIGGLSAHAGPVKGGNTVSINGSGFSNVTSVIFGSVRGTNVKVASSTKLSVQAPAGASAHYISVTTARGGASTLTGRSIYNYLPVPSLRSVNPHSGPAGGGTTVTITGANFAFVRSVYFGPHRGSRLVVISSSRIRIVSPAGQGTVDVLVGTAGGRTRRKPAALFTY